MFQVPNPLNAYAQNPNVGGDVPNIYQIQHKLEQANKVTKYIIYALLAILFAIIFVIVGMTLYHDYQNRRAIVIYDDTSRVVDEVQPEPPVTVIKNTTIIEEIVRYPDRYPDCLNYGELLALVRGGGASSEKYVIEKVLAATQVTGASDEFKVATTQKILDKIDNIALAQEEINKLINLNRTYGKNLDEALACEHSIADAKNKYTDKMVRVRDLERRILEAIDKLNTLRSRRNDLLAKIQDLKDQRSRENSNIDAEIRKIENEIKFFEDEIADLLKNHGVPSYLHLEQLIEEKLGSRGTHHTRKSQMEQDLKRNEELIKSIKKTYETTRSELSSVELRLKTLEWVKNVRHKIEAFSSTREKFRNLKKESLDDGQKNIEMAISSLLAHQARFIQELREAPKDVFILNREHTYREVETIDSESGEIRRQTITTDVQSLDSTLFQLARTYRTIQQEQDLLKLWAQEQLRTLNSTNTEEKELTAKINQLRAEIQDKEGEYEFLFTESMRLKIVIEENESRRRMLEAEIDELNLGLKKLLDLLKDNDELYEKLRTLATLIQDKKRLLEQKQNELEARRNRIKLERSPVEDRLAAAEADLVGLDGEHNAAETQLRQSTNNLNDVVNEEPTLHRIEDENKKCKENVDQANKALNELGDIIRHIQALICDHYVAVNI